jgi:hypothetical protein
VVHVSRTRIPDGKPYFGLPAGPGFLTPYGETRTPVQRTNEKAESEQAADREDLLTE